MGSSSADLAASVPLQVWSADGKRQLGTSASQGPGGTAPPLRRTFLAANTWDGKYYPTDSDAETDEAGFAQLQAGHTYRLKLELYPVLAAADRMVNRAFANEPFVYDLDTKLHVVEDSSDADGDSVDTNKAPSIKAKKTSTGTGGGGSKSKNRRSHSRHSSAQMYSRVQTSDSLVEKVKSYVALPL